MTVQARLHGLKRSALTMFGLRAAAESARGNLPSLLMGAEKAAAAVRLGEHAQRRTGNGEKFWQFREYMPSDRPQDIDWRQSGRGDRVFVRQKEWQTTQTALIWCQRNDGMHYASRTILQTKHEAAATISLALAILMTGAGELVGTLDGSLRPGKSEATLQSLGEKLLEPDIAEIPHALSHEPPRHATIILAGDFLAPLDQTEHAVHALADRTDNILLVQILDPAEMNLPFRGRVIFEHGDGAIRHHITNVDSVRESYQQKINAHIEDLKALCHHHGWHYAQHITDQDAATTVLGLWQTIAMKYKNGGIL